MRSIPHSRMCPRPAGGLMLLGATPTSLLAGAGAQDLVADVTKMDMRVGRVLECQRHPDADR